MYKTYEKYISISQDDSNQLSKDQAKVTSPMGPDFPDFNHPERKRQATVDHSQLEAKCCEVGCDYNEIQALCIT